MQHGLQNVLHKNVKRKARKHSKIKNKGRVDRTCTKSKEKGHVIPTFDRGRAVFSKRL